MKAALWILGIGLAFPAGAQDEFARWVDDLSSDRIEVRDEAARRLEKLGPDAIPLLEAAAAQAPDFEIRTRLTQMVRAIRKRAEFSKVFGETRRVTLDAKDQPIRQILADLSKALGEKIEAEGVDEQKRSTLKLEGATLWEALDRLSRAAELTCEFELEKRIVVRPGAPPSLPVIYLEQFRVGIVEVKRIEHRSPNHQDSVFMLVLEVRHQPNMHPAGDTFAKRFAIDEVKDAKGNEVTGSRPAWGNGMMLRGRPFALQEAVMVRADAVAPLTISGTARIPFARDVKELTVPISGDEGTTEGSFTLKIRAFNQSPAGTTMTLEGRSTDGSEVKNRIEREEFFLVDEKGQKHRGDTSGGAGSGSDWDWHLEFPAAIPKPQKLLFRWIQEYKTVEIPFRFEGVTFPD